MAPLLRFIVLLLGFALVAVCLPSLARAEDPISLRIEAYGLVGLHVLTFRSHIDEAGSRYAVTVDYATRGVAGMVVDVKTHAHVIGHLDTASATPDEFTSDSRRNGTERHNKVKYHRDGSVDATTTPPLPEPPQGRGTVDNLTAYFLLERQLARTGSCRLSVPVFDGRHRYDLYFTDIGRQNLKPAGGQNFQGEAIACHMERRDFGGIPDDEKNEGAHTGTIWYAHLLPGSDVMVPVRMTLDTQIGSVDCYLAELTGRGVNLRLME